MAAVGPCRLLTREIFQTEILPSLTYVLTDCDGVLWKGLVPIQGSFETINAFRKAGKKIALVTNSSRGTRKHLAEKCAKLNFKVSLEECFPSSYCVAVYLKKIGFQGKVYIIAGHGVSNELEQAGIKYVDVGPDPVGNNLSDFILHEFQPDPEVNAVVVGFDEHVSFIKLTKAATYLSKPGCLYIATNLDNQFPTEREGVVVPGTGCIVNAVTTVAERHPIILGKPEKFIVDCVRHECPDLEPSKAIMIGDRLDTDIMMGRRSGIKTVFVLTGVNTLEDVKKHIENKATELVPDYYLPCLGDLLPYLES